MAWLVPLLPAAAAAGLAIATGRRQGDGASRSLLAAVGVLVMAATAALALLAAFSGATGRLAWSDALVLRLDYGLGRAPASAIFAVLVPTVAAPVLAFAARHESARDLGRLGALLVLSVAAMEVVAGSADLLTLLLGWELVGACSALLVGHRWWTAQKSRAGATVFLATRAGDLGLFLAAAAAFAGTGSLEYAALEALGGLHLHLLGAGLLAAAAGKSAQLPFAPWLFAAMKGPVSASALLHASTMVASGAFLLIRLHPVIDGIVWLGPAVLAIGLTTVLAAGLVALLQNHAKRLLAGSTSAHYGVMFVAVGAGYPMVAALHLVAHAFAKAPLFLASGIARTCTGSYALDRMGLRRAVPGAAAASGVAAAAIAGIPPLGAAWTKEEAVAAAGHTGSWAAALLIVAGGLSAAYMARFQLQAFGSGSRTCEARPGRGERWPLHLLAGATALLALLWVSAIHGPAIGALGGELPSSRWWELPLSVALVAVGLAAGAAVARRRPALGIRGAAAAAGDWLGLPALARAGLVRPIRGLARYLARVDDRIVDGGVRAAAGLASAVSCRFARLDDRIVDGGVRRAAGLASAVSRRFARADDRIVDAGVTAAAAFVQWLGALGREIVETLLDGLPEGTSLLVGRAGADARRLQTGFSHHYYRVMMLGLALVLLLLLLGI